MKQLMHQFQFGVLLVVAVLLLTVQPVVAQSAFSLSDTTVTTETNQSVGVNVQLLASDLVDMATVSLSQPTNGSVSFDTVKELVVYTPDIDFVGSDSFIIEAQQLISLDIIRFPQDEDDGRIVASAEVSVSVNAPETSGSVLGATDESQGAVLAETGNELMIVTPLVGILIASTSLWVYQRTKLQPIRL